MTRVKKVGNKDQQTEEKRQKEQKQKLLGKVPWYERPEWNPSEVESHRGRGLMKKNSRRDPSVSLKRKEVNKGDKKNVNEKDIKERHCVLSLKLSKKISDLRV